ncbi:DUF2490 domain-containing protein [Larkinella punicea]|uniref:DUF2490 domain-containing protein n=1 Tax=Larkinella punicea TaxID=2315727 RepID=UPI001403F5C6|nr:DUF2490 domain-containing protein [Larkinella punicea]
MRPGLTYYVSDQVRFTAGYAYARLYPALPPTPGADPLVRPEHRFWQQINWQGHFKRLHLNQWIRAEERNVRKTLGNELADGYSFNYRFRYMITVQVPLKGDTPNPVFPTSWFRMKFTSMPASTLPIIILTKTAFLWDWPTPSAKVYGAVGLYELVSTAD